MSSYVTGPYRILANAEQGYATFTACPDANAVLRVTLSRLMRASAEATSMVSALLGQKWESACRYGLTWMCLIPMQPQWNKSQDVILLTIHLLDP